MRAQPVRPLGRHPCETWRSSGRITATARWARHKLAVGVARRRSSPRRSRARRRPPSRESRHATGCSAPTKPAVQSVAGKSYTSAGVPQLLDRAVAHDDDPIRHAERLLLVVCDVDEGRAEPRVGSRRSSTCMSSRSLRSSAPSGSSSSSTLGRLVSARASAMRCRMPPESSSGRLGSRVPAAPTRASRRRAASARPFDAAAPSAHSDVALDGHMRKQRVALEHRVDVPTMRRSGRHVAAASSPAQRREARSRR